MRQIRLIFLLLAAAALGAACSARAGRFFQFHDVTQPTFNVTMQNAAVGIGPGTPISVGGLSSAAIQITGNNGSTITFSSTVDGVNYTPIAGTPVAGGAGATTSTTNGIWQFNVNGLDRLQAAVTTYTAGTITAQAKAK